MSLDESFSSSSTTRSPTNTKRNSLTSSSPSPLPPTSQAKLSRWLGPESIRSADVEGDEDAREHVAPEVIYSHEDLRINAKILRADVTKDTSGNEYVLYDIFISTGSNTAPSTGSGHNGLQWHVHRRFKEFEALHSSLSAKFGADHLPTFPKKALLRNLDPEYVRKRKLELAKYLQDLCLDGTIATSSILAHFLLSNLQDLIKSNISSYSLFTERAGQLKELEQQLSRSTVEHAQIKKAIQADLQKASDEAAQRTRDECAVIAQNDLTVLHQAWEQKFAQLVARTKELQSEKKTALKCVQDLDVLVRRLKVEKKVLIKEVKENRAQLAALGALGHTAGTASKTSAASESVSGVVSPTSGGSGSQSVASKSGSRTPATGGGATHATPTLEATHPIEVIPEQALQLPADAPEPQSSPSPTEEPSPATDTSVSYYYLPQHDSSPTTIAQSHQTTSLGPLSTSNYAATASHIAVQDGDAIDSNDLEPAEEEESLDSTLIPLTLAQAKSFGKSMGLTSPLAATLTLEEAVSDLSKKMSLEE